MQSPWQAGEVAEPYRFLIVADFPSNFTAEAAKKLMSIATIGPSCGVYVLIMIDITQQLPRDFNLNELESCCICLSSVENGIVWDDPDFQSWPLLLDKPAESGVVIDILNAIGQKAKECNQVRVPFDFIAPELTDRWKYDTCDNIRVALGRAGATKQQCLEIGKGTAQHVLITGKTGSGKSNLLHVMITNLALSYSPQQVELYLIDFKKGVEFKTYATQKLPHARVIAIESEREFGLNILERLDQQLTERGELFRDHHVNHIGEFRRANPNNPLPRALLIVDEFHEFFTEDDYLARQAEQFLDRLVRQGRAFGIHVILGSQTLAGRYRLPTATLDQMAIRIALQSSDSDSRLVLDKDNSAAHLLSRPGEAIYNDANGREEGNNLFQIVWFSDETREKMLSSPG